MTPVSRLSRVAIAGVALSLVAAACSDDESSDTTAASVDTAAADTETTVESTETTASTATTGATDTTEAPETTESADTTVPETTEAPETTDAPTTTEASVGTLVDVAAGAGNFTTLLAAVEAAGLTETLATGKFTVLAPTDEAFAKVDPAALEALLADPAALTAVLENHLLPLPQDAATLTIFNSVVTVAGTSLPVVEEGGVVTIGGATVVTADVQADNGVIHAIDTVLLPAAP